MTETSRLSLAVLGAGPIGLEAAALALEHGLDVHVFERGEVGAHALAWGHVRMFTPWRMNVGAAGARLLAQHGVPVPAGEDTPTGLELAERLLQPLAATPALAKRVHAHQQVVAVSRRGLRKHELAGDPARAEQPFRLLVRDAGGHESLLHAHAVIDATGTYGQPGWAGTGGIPARGESYLAPQMSYHPDDVLGLRRERHAGRTTLVLGGGSSAITTVAALARLADASPETRAVWVTRRAEPGFAGEQANDSLPARAALNAEGRRLQQGGSPAVRWVGGCEVDGFEYNSATHRYRTQLTTPEGPRVEESDQVIVNCGYAPDASLYGELQVDVCALSLAPLPMSEALRASAPRDCTQQPVFEAARIANREPGFFVLGAKSYGRRSQFLLESGYRQAANVVAFLAEMAGTAAAR